MDLTQEQLICLSIDELNELLEQNTVTIEDFSQFDYTVIDSIESNLDAFDYCFSIAVGLGAAFLASSKGFSEWLQGIHEVASGATGDYDFLQKMLGKLLHHKNDTIDQIDGAFVTRSENGDRAYPLFHRLLWGHDSLSVAKDNPFYLMFKQKGFVGIVQALRHLLADTASKQGLPLPGSSFLDYEKDGKTTNYLISISQQISKDVIGNKSQAEGFYEHLFILRAADMVGTSFITLCLSVYCKIRKLDDNIRNTQIRLISYTVGFLAEAIIGMIKQSGVPYINFPMGTAAAKNMVQMFYYNIKEIKQLEKETNRLIFINDSLEKQTADTSAMLSQNLSFDFEYENLMDAMRIVKE